MNLSKSKSKTFFRRHFQDKDVYVCSEDLADGEAPLSEIAQDVRQSLFLSEA